MSKFKTTFKNRSKKPIKSATIRFATEGHTARDIYEIIVKDSDDHEITFRQVFEPMDESETTPEGVSYEYLSVDLNNIKEVFMTLNSDQRKIVMHVYYLYKNKYLNQGDLASIEDDAPKIIIQGPAGTGKSTIINLIEKLVTWEENRSSNSPGKLRVLKCAYTGKAASNIDGGTLHHTFSLPVYKGKQISKIFKREVLNHVTLFVCDEISMVGQLIMKNVNDRLKQIFKNQKLYGNRFVLLVGDLYQINPVGDTVLYKQSEYWDCCEFYELTKIMRQRCDEKYIKALNNFRDSKMDDEDIALLKSREVRDSNEVPDGVINLFYYNDDVNDFNDNKINNTPGHEEVVNVTPESENEQKITPLRIKIGIRYMLVHNTDVSDGLTNGATGIVRGFDYEEKENPQTSQTESRVCVIWMEFNSEKVGKKLRDKYFKTHSKPGYEQWVPIKQIKFIANIKQTKAEKKTKKYRTRTILGFPLRAAEAITVHKSQGQTYDNGACIHLCDTINRDKSILYVALTRVTELKYLYIKGNFDVSKVKVPERFEQMENELKRLRTDRKLNFAYDTLEDDTKDVIIYLNTGSTFCEHQEFISTDNWYENASLIILSEANTTAANNKLFDFVPVDYNYGNMVFEDGTICYKRKSKALSVLDMVKNEEKKTYLTLLLYDNALYILTLAKKDMTDQVFTNIIKHYALRYGFNDRMIILIDDCSLDENINSLFNNLGFVNRFSCNKTVNNGVEYCDAVFTKNVEIPDTDFGFYEYIPSSSHKPIYFKIPQFKSHVESYHFEPEE